jgi:hypothetical protein
VSGPAVLDAESVARELGEYQDAQRGGPGGLARLDLSPDTARHVLTATAIALGVDGRADA